MQRVSRKQNDRRAGVAPNGGNYLFVGVIGNQAATNQKKVDRIIGSAFKKGRKRVLLHLIRVEQDGKCFAARQLIIPEYSQQTLWEPVCGIGLVGQLD